MIAISIFVHEEGKPLEISTTFPDTDKNPINKAVKIAANGLFHAIQADRNP